MVTIGVEEEYLLLDGETWLPSPRASQVQASANLESGLGVDEVDKELLQAQVEVATPICTGLDEVEAHLLRFRKAVAAAAARVGCRVAASGSAPLAGRRPVPVTEEPRYLAIRAQAAQLVDEQLINGMHIHVAVPDRASGAGALGRVRPWLPVLVALGANSPFWEGQDTGFGSWRTVVFGRWPVSGVPPFFAGEEDYDRCIAGLVATGVVREPRQLYWHARLSERYPTLEVRAPDVQLDVDSAVMLAGLSRALVATALREEKAGAPPLLPPHEVVQAAGWHSARHGLGSDLVDPLHGRPAPAADVVGSLLGYVGAQLDEAGDTERVTATARNLLDNGTGADRQRRAMREDGLSGVLDLIAPAAAERPAPAAAPAEPPAR